MLLHRVLLLHRILLLHRVVDLLKPSSNRTLRIVTRILLARVRIVQLIPHEIILIIKMLFYQQTLLKNVLDLVSTLFELTRN
jgi:hypothetical protein